MNEKLDFSVEEKTVTMKTDFDQDGKESSKLTLFMSEAIQELVDKGVKKEDVKIVDFELSPMGIKLVLDTDRDGEALMSYEVSFGEAFGEALGAISKK